MRFGHHRILSMDARSCQKITIFYRIKNTLGSFRIDLELFKPRDAAKARSRFSIPEGNIVLAFRASEWIYKGLNYIRKCLRKLSTDKPITLLVFSETGLLKEFEKRFQVIDLGWVDDDDLLIDAYNASDIFLMPSIAESFGMMAMEAMACGKPVIVMDNTALSEVVKSEESGCVVIPQGNIAEMCKQLEILINNPSLCQNIGNRSLKTAQKYYDKDRYVREIALVYESAIARKVEDERVTRILAQQVKNCFSNTSENEIEINKNRITILLRKRIIIELFERIGQSLVTNKITGFILLRLAFPTLKAIQSFYLLLIKKSKISK